MGSVANSPFNEAQLQRRLDLERKLDADLDELAKLQGSLMKSNALTEKMVSLITDYFDLASKEETYISKGPSSDDLKPYIAVVSKMKEALHYLTTTRYRAAETAIAMLKLVLLKAQRHYDILFRRWLSQCSSPIDPTLHYLDPDSPPVVPPQKLMEDLHTIAQELGSLDMAPGEKGDVRDYVKAYADVRSAYLSRSLAPLATSAAALDLKKGAGYQRGMNPLCPLVRCFLRMIKTERELISKLIIKPQALACFHATISPAADALLEVGEQQVSRAKRNLARREHNDLYLLIDTAETLTACVRESDGMIAYAGSKGGEVVEMVAGMKAAAVGFFKGFLEDIQGDVQKSGLPTDGTVHEITSVTINIVRRLLDFESGVDMMLTYARTTASTLSPSTFPALVVDMLESLFATLDAKSKGYKKNTLAYIFLLNNYYYIHKQIKSMRTADFLPKELMTKYETAWVKQKDLYRESWKPCFDYLMDTTYVQAGGVKAMTKAQRDGVKDRFKNFNSEFDSTYSTQRVYTISDPELKAQVVKDIKGVLLPLYTRFLDRYRDSEFSKNPSKYIRYDKESLEAVLDRFFDGAA
ncbi:Exocyst complex component 7 [Irineochytrium annulatum]|nr:Exocyst complex component 7 [Irineochytrium annulatum]